MYYVLCFPKVYRCLSLVVFLLQINWLFVKLLENKFWSWYFYSISQEEKMKGELKIQIHFLSVNGVEAQEDS